MIVSSDIGDSQATHSIQSLVPGREGTCQPVTTPRECPAPVTGDRQKNTTEDTASILALVADSLEICAVVLLRSVEDKWQIEALCDRGMGLHVGESLPFWATPGTAVADADIPYLVVEDLCADAGYAALDSSMIRVSAHKRWDKLSKSGWMPATMQR